MPQHVWPWGNSTVTPRRRSSVTIATPTSGKNRSPRQVIMMAALIGAGTGLAAGAGAVGRRGRDHDEHEERLGAVIDEAVLDAGRREQGLAGDEPFFALAQGEAAGAFQHVVDLVLPVVGVRRLRLPGRDAVQIEL